MSVLTVIERNEEGYLVNPNDWNKEVAQEIASELDVNLDDLAWKAIDFARMEYETNGEPPTLRRITKAGGVPTKDIYRIFPKGPASKIAKIAGLGKPTGCI